MANMRSASPPNSRARRSFSVTFVLRADRMKRLILPPARRSTVTGTLRGRSIVVALYGVIVGITGVVGAILGAFGPDDLTPVALFGVIDIQPTPLGLAVYGATTIGLILGVLLGLVAYVSRRVDADRAGEKG